MPDDEHSAQIMPMLMSDLIRSDVERFEEEQQKDKAARAALRKSSNAGMTMGELLKDIDGDPEEAQRKLQDELAKLSKEAQAAVAERDK